jgi:hypothetical protein
MQRQFRRKDSAIFEFWGRIPILMASLSSKPLVSMAEENA